MVYIYIEFLWLYACLVGSISLFACELAMFVSLFVRVGPWTVAEPVSLIEINQTCMISDALEQQSVVYI